MADKTLIDIVALDIFEGEGDGKGPYRSGTWSKKIGELVNEGETVTCLQYDKVDFELPSPATGVLVETLVQYTDDIEIGQVLGRLDPRAEPWVFPGHGDWVVEEGKVVPAGGQAAAIGRCKYCEALVYPGDLRCRNCGGLI